MRDNLSILLLSCDKYIDVVRKNLEFLDKYWSKCPYDIYIGVESAQLEYNGELKIHMLHFNGAFWSERVMNHLRALSADNVLIILDDFFVEECVNEDIIDEAYDLLVGDKRIANVVFAHISGEKDETKMQSVFECRVKKSLSLLNWQIGIWRKDALLALMQSDENPWQSEIYGSLRARYLSDYEFYCIDSDLHMPLVYGRGWLIVRGKWNSNEIERLEEKCEIEINPENRPVEPIKTIPATLWSRVNIRLSLIKYQLRLIVMSSKRRKNL